MMRLNSCTRVQSRRIMFNRANGLSPRSNCSSLWMMKEVRCGAPLCSTLFQFAFLLFLPYCGWRMAPRQYINCSVVTVPRLALHLLDCKHKNSQACAVCTVFRSGFFCVLPASIVQRILFIIHIHFPECPKTLEMLLVRVNHLWPHCVHVCVCMFRNVNNNIASVIEHDIHEMMRNSSKHG